jgi:hypothetical protein
MRPSHHIKRQNASGLGLRLVWVLNKSKTLFNHDIRGSLFLTVHGRSMLMSDLEDNVTLIPHIHTQIHTHTIQAIDAHASLAVART